MLNGLAGAVECALVEGRRARQWLRHRLQAHLILVCINGRVYVCVCVCVCVLSVHFDRVERLTDEDEAGAAEAARNELLDWIFLGRHLLHEKSI